MISECPELVDSAVCVYEHTELRCSTTVDRFWLVATCRAWPITLRCPLSQWRRVAGHGAAGRVEPSLAARLALRDHRQTEPDGVSGERRYHGSSILTLVMNFARVSVRLVSAEHVWLAPIALDLNY